MTTENWARIFARLVDGQSPACPACGSFELIAQFAGDPTTRMGFAMFHCEGCEAQGRLSRVKVPEHLNMVDWNEEQALRRFTESRRPARSVARTVVQALVLESADGRARVGTYIIGDPRSDDSREASGEAQLYFKATCRGKAIIAIEHGDTLADLGVDPENVQEWSTLRASLNLDYLQSLERRGVAPRVLELIGQNVACWDNRLLFQEGLADAKYREEEHAAVCRAHDVARVAHLGMAQGREQDETGLFHIPYFNHCVCMAINGLKLGLSAEDVQVLLLHDVVEDTHLTCADLEQQFSVGVVDRVRLLTREDGVSRSEFIERLNRLESSTKRLKALDRYDNMLRAFSLPSRKYALRVLRENRMTYAGAFSSDPLLQVLRDDFAVLDAELARIHEIQESEVIVGT